VQVADRWHLLGNLGDALTSLFDQHRPAVEHHLRPPTVGSVATPEFSGPSLSSSTSILSPGPARPEAVPVELAEPPALPALPRPVSIPASPLSQRKQEEQARRRAQRQARYEQVRRLHDQGWGLSAIGDQVGLDRNTVRKYIQASAFPERQPRSPQASILDPFQPYMLQRWNAGCYTGSTLLREARERGYAGSDTIVRNYITQLRNASGLPPKKRKGVQAKEVSDPTQRIPSSRRLTWLVLRQSATLDETDQQRLAQLRDAHPDMATAITLAQEFATLVRQRQPEQLDNWLERTEQSGLAPLISFVKGIRRDYAAVKAGVTLIYSNGPTEGHVNRLKMLKRQMFGRAKLDLLKIRLMAA
jgi:transposase